MPAQTPFQRELERIGRNTAGVYLQTYRAARAAGMGRLETIELLGAIAYAAAAQGETIGRNWLVSDLTDKGIEAADALLDDYTPRANLDAKTGVIASLFGAGRTDEDGEPDHQGVELEQRLERLGTNDPIEAAQMGYSDGMRDSEHVGGWVRSLEADACELCVWLYRDGFIYAPERPITTHPGCVCTAEPLTPDEVRAAADARYSAVITTPGGTSRQPVPARGGQTVSAYQYSYRQREIWRDRADRANIPAKGWRVAEDGRRSE